MDDVAKQRLKLYGGSALVALVLIGGVWIHQEDTISGNHDHVHTERVKAKNFTAKRHDMTVATIKNHYDKSNPDIGSVMSKTTKKINKGVAIAYNDIPNNSAYSHNYKKVDRILGSSVGDPILSIIKPTGLSAMSEKQVSPSAHLEKCTVSYGQYNDNDDAIPVLVNIKYRTPAFNKKADQGDMNPKNKKVHTGKTVVSASLNVQDGSLQSNSKPQNQII